VALFGKRQFAKRITSKIKESSLLQEENITKKLYADYSKFREAIYNNLVKTIPKPINFYFLRKPKNYLTVFCLSFLPKTDLLLPAKFNNANCKKWKDYKHFGDMFPLRIPLKSISGIEYRFPKWQKIRNIYAYNGGLFAPDEILDNISIDDELLHKHTLTLSSTILKPMLM
jgi:hypothetical protein